MIELWIKQATGLSVWQSCFLLFLCVVLVGLVMFIDLSEEKEKW